MDYGHAYFSVYGNYTWFCVSCVSCVCTVSRQIQWKHVLSGKTFSRVEDPITKLLLPIMITKFFPIPNDYNHVCLLCNPLFSETVAFEASK